MIPEIGQITLVLAFLVAVAQSVLPMIGAQRRDLRLMAFGDQAALVQFALIGLAFAILTLSFIQSDFSVELTAMHSHSDKPPIYKISGAWGNHEGSMMLWITILALFGASCRYLARISRQH